MASDKHLRRCCSGVGRRRQNVGMRLRRAGEAREAYREIHLLDSLWLRHYDCCGGVRRVWVGVEAQLTGDAPVCSKRMRGQRWWCGKRSL